MTSIYYTDEQIQAKGVVFCLETRTRPCLWTKALQDQECLMHDAEGSDLKGIRFCPGCSGLLKSKGWKLVD